MNAQRKIFGDYGNRLDELCDSQEAARILTLRAAREFGVYRVYTDKTIHKAVQNGKLKAVVDEEGARHYFLREHVKNMSIKPTRARKPPTIAQLERKLAEARAAHDIYATHASHTTIEKLEKVIELAEEGERESAARQKELEEERARRLAEQQAAEPPPKVANI